MKFTHVISILSFSLFLWACGSGLPDPTVKEVVITAPSTDSSPTPSPTPITVFTTGMAASVVIGQVNFSSGASALTQSRFNTPFSLDVDSSGVLRVADTDNRRVMIYNSIPTTSGVSADYVLGQPNFTTNTQSSSATGFKSAIGASSSGTRFLMSDLDSNRVNIYSPLPTSGNPAISVVVGSTATNTDGGGGCLNNEFTTPRKAIIAGGKLFIASMDQNRILIFNSVPTTNGAPADVVVGQANMTSCASSTTANTLSFPVDVWSDGTKLIVAEQGNNRVLIWNSIPTTNNQPADLVLGQPNFVSSTPNNGGISASTLNSPRGITVNAAQQLFVSDSGNNRILIWNTFPTTNNQAADVVLGQPNMTSDSSATTSTGLNGANQLKIYSNKLIVADTSNNRVLVFEGQ